MLAHHFSHYYSRRCRWMVPEVTDVINPSKKKVPLRTGQRKLSSTYYESSVPLIPCLVNCVQGDSWA